nr:immunoglobulin heavy chain junction region [Mus musculus]
CARQGLLRSFDSW